MGSIRYLMLGGPPTPKEVSFQLKKCKPMGADWTFAAGRRRRCSIRGQMLAENERHCPIEDEWRASARANHFQTPDLPAVSSPPKSIQNAPNRSRSPSGDRNSSRVMNGQPTSSLKESCCGN